MPTYCYTTEDGERTVERVFKMGKAPRKVFLKGGAWAFRDLRAEHGGFKDTPGNWPMVSIGLGVQPSQVAEGNKAARAMGLKTRYLADGRLEIPNRTERNRHLKVMGAHDRDAGYGDR